MKVIVLGPNYQNYEAASYQYEFMKELHNLSDSYYHYEKSEEISIKELISLQNLFQILFFIITVGFRIILI